MRSPPGPLASWSLALAAVADSVCPCTSEAFGLGSVEMPQGNTHWRLLIENLAVHRSNGLD